MDLTEGGLVLLRDSGGRTIASDPKSLLIEPMDERASAIYLQSIHDVKTWRSSSLEKASSYRAPIRFAKAQDGKLAAINELALEYYLLGVVGPEIGNFAPDEVLKAQAVAARSEAWAKLRQGYVSKDPLYDFTATSPQVYRGWREENAAVRRAVDGTRGQILTWHGQPVDAVYGHSCGGVVAEVSEVWGGAPLAWSRRRMDQKGNPGRVELSSWDASHELTRSSRLEAFCSPHQDGFPRYAQKHFRWTRALSADDLTRLIDPVYRTGRIRGIEVEQRAASGRVQRLRVVGTQKTVVLKKELHIRGALGNLKSTFFTFTTDDEPSGDLERIHLWRRIRTRRRNVPDGSLYDGKTGMGISGNPPPLLSGSVFGIPLSIKDRKSSDTLIFHGYSGWILQLPGENSYTTGDIKRPVSASSGNG